MRNILTRWILDKTLPILKTDFQLYLCASLIQKMGFELAHCKKIVCPDVTYMGRLDKELTHWGRVTHICVGNLTTIGSDNGLSPDRRQAII